MNELKPEDVMRALECWASGKPCQEECSILEHEEGASCLKLTTRSALALLREKDAEIERLNNTLADALVRAEVAKVETITEFAERLKYTLCINNEENTEVFDYAYTLETIDQNAKEMRERANDSEIERMG